MYRPQRIAYTMSPDPLYLYTVLYSNLQVNQLVQMEAQSNSWYVDILFYYSF